MTAAQAAKAIRDMAEATCRQTTADESGWDAFEKACATVLQRFLAAQ